MGIWHHAVMAKELELFYWWFVDETTGQRRRTSCAMDRETAIELYGNIQADEPTRIVRTVCHFGEAPPNPKVSPQLHAVEIRNLPDAAQRPE